MKKYKSVTPSDKAIVGIKGKDGEIISCIHINWATDGLVNRPGLIGGSFS